MLWRPDSTAVFVGWACGLALALVVVRFAALPRWNPPAVVYRTAAAFMLIDLATTVYFRIDIVLMEQLGVAPADIGRYAAAYRIFEGGVLLLAPAATVFFRELRLRWQDRDAARSCCAAPSAAFCCWLPLDRPWCTGSPSPFWYLHTGGPMPPQRHCCPGCWSLSFSWLPTMC